MNRSEALKKADEYVSKDRNSQYGDPENSFSTIAALWNAYLEARPKQANVDAYDVANMMSLLKVARLAIRPQDLDSAVDLAGYAACAAEILSRENAKREPVPQPMAAPAPPPPIPAPAPAKERDKIRYSFEDA